MNKTKIIEVIIGTALVLIVPAFFACSAATTTSTTPTLTLSSTTTPNPGGGALINSDSIITAKIQAIRQKSSGFPWELDVLVQSSVDVGSLPNPTKDSVGKVITVETDQDVTSFKVNDVVTAKVKYVGDVPQPGITLYIYNIQMQINQ
jgi:hypothetical protein